MPKRNEPNVATARDPSQISRPRCTPASALSVGEHGSVHSVIVRLVHGREALAQRRDVRELRDGVQALGGTRRAGCDARDDRAEVVAEWRGPWIRLARLVRSVNVELHAHLRKRGAWCASRGEHTSMGLDGARWAVWGAHHMGGARWQAHLCKRECLGGALQLQRRGEPPKGLRVHLRQHTEQATKVLWVEVLWVLVWVRRRGGARSGCASA
jgi:hypothetical protein